jgi:hypothetical protein
MHLVVGGEKPPSSFAGGDLQVAATPRQPRRRKHGSTSAGEVVGDAAISRRPDRSTSTSAGEVAGAMEPQNFSFDAGRG